ncbi:hypothetical protein INT45_001012 [Circinella minor]|uniref:Uncharacterized protein n=1 Tax=Circinella minor TaxID=1195481 RepID=A0A8H7SDM3_9FUNG|nr:hypothetical protein INT45_001012 [Circinella minor]
MTPAKNEPTFEPSFCAMLTRCPGLQALIIQNPLGVVPYHHDHDGLLESYQVNITNTVLVVLATSCTQLKQVTIEGTCHGYTPSGFNRYANSNGSNNLEYLKVDLNPDDYDIPQIVNMLPRLVTLYCNNLGFQTRFAVQPLLQQRGGSLLEDRYFPW